MNTKLLLILGFVLLSTLSYAQIQLSATAGLAPSQSFGTQSIALDETMFGRDYAFTAARKNMSYTGAVTAKFGIAKHFYLLSEARYLYESSDYTLAIIESTYNPENTPMEFNEQQHRLVVPVGVGAKFGRFDLHSGVDMNFMLSQSSELEGLESYSYTGSTFFPGWHAGAGFTFGPVGLEVRYSQDFRNVGEGHTFGSQDIQFYGYTSRWLMSVSYRLL